ncbi:MAG: F0F1 ATP synthase subunit A, partial [Erysipelotrichaceae bacterium]|nr:F0F1 ATP synthase subunit A [Erysipelotrichaceae bacterium]
MFELQATVLSIIIITIVLIVFLVILNGKLKKFDPMDEPKGLVLLAMVATQMVDKNVRDKTNDKVAKYLTPYIM